MSNLKELEILGKGSLLKAFADMAAKICANNNDYKVFAGASPANPPG